MFDLDERERSGRQALSHCVQLNDRLLCASLSSRFARVASFSRSRNAALKDTTTTKWGCKTIFVNPY